MTLHYVHFETSDELAKLTNSLGIKQGEIECIASDSSGQWTLFYWAL
jgi:hypothetical protein